jgi:hypothetical protein
MPRFIKIDVITGRTRWSVTYDLVKLEGFSSMFGALGSRVYKESSSAFRSRELLPRLGHLTAVCNSNEICWRGR